MLSAALGAPMGLTKEYFIYYVFSRKPQGGSRRPLGVLSLENSKMYSGNQQENGATFSFLQGS
jgi:hypothetical protein